MKEIVLPQVVSAGIFDAHLAIKNRAVSKNRKTTMFEIELPIGNGGTSYIDNRSHAISENLVICARPGQTRHTRLPFKCYFIHIIVKEGRLRDILNALDSYIEIQNADRLRAVFEKICENHSAGLPENEIMLQSLILELIYLLSSYSTSAKIGSGTKNNNHKIIEDTVEYIKNNLTSELDLKTLSDAAKFTPTYFHKLFKASTGETLHDFVENQRIKKSLSLLISTDMTLTEIAYECGFSSQSYFSYAFKRKMGITPRAYVKEQINRYTD